MTASPPAALARARNLSPTHGWHRPWLAALALAVMALPACGGAGARTQSTHSSTARPTVSASGTVRPAPTGAAVATAYCAAQDTAIPDAAQLLQGAQVPGLVLTPVETAWLQMGATMVPACSEITPDAPPVETKNLSNGAISDAALATWVQEDNQHWAVWEWAQQNKQGGVLRFLEPLGSNLTAFIAAGGKIVDSAACEFPAKVYAVALTVQQQADLSMPAGSTAEVAFTLAWVGPCTSIWTAADGTVTDENLGTGQELRELDVTDSKSSVALGNYLEYEAGADQGSDPAVDAILSNVGI
jgi:hypothetical protein